MNRVKNTKKINKKKIINVTKGIRKNRNNIVLMHDFSGNTKTLNALRDIIKYGKANGYTFERINEDTPMITQKIAN